jgi:hypothetical protein
MRIELQIVAGLCRGAIRALFLRLLQRAAEQRESALKLP